MIKFVIFSVLFAGCYAANVRIVNGTDASEGEFPFVVSLRVKEISHTCGATILNEKFVLTAAHCVCVDSTPKENTFTIQYGSVKISKDLTRSIPVKKINCNTFSTSKLIFDAAVLELETPLPNSGNWKSVKLAKEFDSSLGMDGATIVGWGGLWKDGPIPEILQKLDVEIYPDELCSLFCEPEHDLCLGVRIGGACNGDSGTALLFNGEQVGIASFITATCGIATPLHPNVYSRVSRYYDWIAKTAGL